MEVDNTVINYICTTIYEIIPIEQSIKQLWGYDDRNFSLVDSANHQSYLLKITNETESRPELTDIIDEILDSAHSYFENTKFVVPKLIRTSANKLSTLVDVSLRNAANGDLERKRCNVKLFEYFDGITLFDFVHQNGSNLGPLAETYYQVGRLANRLFEFLHTRNHLIEQLRKCRQGFSWQLATCEPFLRDQLASGVFGEVGIPENEVKRSLVQQVLDEFSAMKSRLDLLPQFVVHGDLGTRNILMDAKRQPTCIVDFGDIQVGNQMTDLAVAMLYGVLEQETDFRLALEWIPAQILRGYLSVNKSSSCKLADQDLDLALILMKVRLCQSLVNAQLASQRDPTNSCAATSLKNGWTLLEILVGDSKYSNPTVMTRLWRELSSA